MDRKELEILLDEHFETPLQGERLETLDRALSQNPDLRREFEAHHRIVETLRTLKAPPAPVSLRERILAQARAEAAEGASVSIAVSPEPPKRKATVFSVVRTVCSRWQVQTLAAACLAVALFYHVLPQLNPNLRKESIGDKLAYSTTKSAKDNQPLEGGTQVAFGTRKNAPSDVNSTSQAAEYSYFSTPPVQENVTEIASPIPLLTAPPLVEAVKEGTSPAGSSARSEKTETDKLKIASEPHPENFSSPDPPKEEALAGVEVNLAEPISILGTLPDKKADPRKTVRVQAETETGAVEGAAVKVGKAEEAKDSVNEERVQGLFDHKTAPSTPPVNSATPLNAIGDIQAKPDKAPDAIASKGEVQDQTAKGVKREAIPTPAPTSRPKSKAGGKTGNAQMDRIFPLNEKKSRDSEKTPSSAAPALAAGMAGAALAPAEADSVRLALSKEQKVAEGKREASVLPPPSENANGKRPLEVASPNVPPPVKPTERAQTPAPQKRATPQLARQLIAQPDAGAPEAAPDKETEDRGAKAKEKVAAESAQPARPSASPRPAQAGRSVIAAEEKRGDSSRQRAQDNAGTAADKDREKDPTSRSAFVRAGGAPVKKALETPVSPPAKPASSGSVNLIVSVQVGAGVSLEDVASLFRGDATVSQSGGRGKTLGTLTCTASGKNQQWVLDQLRGGGIQAKGTAGAKGSYEVNKSGTSPDGESSFVFKITVTRR